MALTAVALDEPWDTTEHRWLSTPLTFSPLALQQEPGWTQHAVAPFMR